MAGPLILPLLAVLLQNAPPHPPDPPSSPPARDEKPVHVWLDAGGPVARGDPVRVYVRTAADGFLIVVRRSTDGHIRVLFPANPSDYPFVRGGTYEIRSPGDGVAPEGRGGGGPAFVVAEPDGQGLVLAAVSPSSFRFDEFVRVADWNPDALAPSWEGADAVGGVTDVVQRMLGDGYFNYDIATYTVAPRVYAQAPSPTSAPQDTAPPPPCVDCTFIGSQIVIIESPLFGFDESRFHRRSARGERGGGGCDQSSSCAPPPPGAASAIALPSRYTVTPSGELRRRNDALVRPRLPVSSTTIGPRRRQSVARDLPATPSPTAIPVSAIPLVPGRRTPAAGVVMGRGRGRGGDPSRRSGTEAGVWAPTRREVRLTMSPIPVREEPPAPSSGASAVQANLSPLRSVLGPAAGERSLPASMRRSFVMPGAVSQARTGGGWEGTRSTADVGGESHGSGEAVAQTHVLAVPMAAWRSAVPRGGMVTAGVRRH